MKLKERPIWKELPFACCIPEPGNSVYYKTGDWKTLKPVVDKMKCIKCGTCWIFCPEYAFEEDEYGYFEPNLEYCKGCGICARECPAQCIKMEEEVVE
ncbi:MAG TPA: 4Fe-4S dicluster domain-containing protein [Thermosulfidibacter takaii]|uniref:4Fe-4S dicluster domain-containing protein n=1 Tax=Thermosulfidibacter takaii TaxID=412593 RepID=A0A7C0Y8I1_9BACT|nr:4Fe-4S dicluster domain-containing protein [Thermosulfidibacter takaii]